MKKSVSHFTCAILFWTAITPTLATAQGVVPNDDFASATVISGGSGATSGDNTGATQEPNEPEYLTIFGNGQSIWWRWTAPESIRYTFDTVGSGIDTILGIYQGTNLGDLEPVLEADDGVSGSFESRGSFLAVAGTEYFIAVDMFFEEEPGPITLNWYPQPVPVLTAPAMVYNLRQVLTEQGYNMDRESEDEPVFLPRSTSVVTGLVVRGRGDQTTFDSGYEVGPVAVIELYTKRVGRTLTKYYTLMEGLPDDSNEFVTFGMESSLIRVGTRASNVFEVAAIEAESGLTFDFASIRSLKGQASLTKILPSQQAAVWFARKLTSSSEEYSSGLISETLVQGQPIEGNYFKDVSTLTFNATETRAVEGEVLFDDIVMAVIMRLEAKGYLSSVFDVE